MRPRAPAFWLTVFLLLNTAVVVCWLWLPRAPAPLRVLAPAYRPSFTNVLRPIRTNFVFEPRLLSWRDLESTNYFTFIGNLRAIGCPEETIRDLVVAEINELFSRRRAAEVATPEQQWWRAEPDEKVAESAAAKLEALDTERRRLLTELLGPGWDNPDRFFAPIDHPNELDGPILGQLTDEAKAAVRRIEAQAQTRRHAATNYSAAEEARLSLATREELAKVLTPAQLEEYLLRYSDTADQLRTTTRAFETSPDEFRRLFQATDALDNELATLADQNDPAAANRRRELQQKREEAMRQTLGNDRYAAYQLAQEPGFQQAREVAQSVGAPAEIVMPMYQINQAVARERQRILGDNTLSVEEQSEELANLQQERLSTLRRLLGDETFNKLQSTSGGP